MTRSNANARLRIALVTSNPVAVLCMRCLESSHHKRGLVNCNVLRNDALLVKIEGPVWYTIYNHLPVVKGVNKPLY